MKNDEQQLRAAVRSLLADPKLTRELATLEPSAVRGIVTRLGLAEVAPGVAQKMVDSLSEGTSNCCNSMPGNSASAEIATLVAAAMAI